MTSYDSTAKVYILKVLVLLETSITEFHEIFCILEIQKMAFHLPHVRILGTHHCGKERREAFKHHGNSYVVLCRFGYEELLVSSIDRQIRSEYYGDNRYVSIEVISLENSVYYTSPVYCWHHIMCQCRHCFTPSYTVTANRIPQSQLNTVNPLLNCCKTEKYCFLT